MISIIVPTYNEAKNITDLVVRIKNSLPGKYEIIVVDDGSPDGTGRVAEDLAREYPIKVIHREGKMGLASAVLDGFKIASGDLLGVIDSDLSHPPEIIPLLLKEMEKQNADIIIASRFAKGGGTDNWPKIRLFATNVAMLSVRLLTSVKDPMSGFFIFKKSVIEDTKLIPRGFKILLEILVKGHYTKAIEFPFVFKDRIHGKSKIDLKVYTEFTAQLIDLYFYKLKNLF